jgi:cytochrome d ubiquinol oxidase subunit I
MLLGAFFVMSISAFYVLRQRHLEVARRSFLVALVFGAVFSWGALLTGDGHANQVARTQPAKLAAMEGHFHTGAGGAPLHVFGIPDEAAQEVRYAIVIPGGLSFLVHHDFNRPVPGLDRTPPQDRPPVVIPFFSFHLMVAIGTALIALTLLGLAWWWRGTLFEQRWLMGLFVVAVLGPYAANQAGWVTAEVGRQPWIVYGLLRTAGGVSKVVAANAVLGSIVMFGFIYFLLFLVWVYVMNDKIQHGPDPLPALPGTTTPEGWLDAAALHQEEGRASLTDTHQEGA